MRGMLRDMMGIIRGMMTLRANIKVELKNNHQHFFTTLA